MWCKDGDVVSIKYITPDVSHIDITLHLETGEKEGINRVSIRLGSHRRGKPNI